MSVRKCVCLKTFSYNYLHFQSPARGDEGKGAGRWLETIASRKATRSPYQNCIWLGRKMERRRDLGGSKLACPWGGVAVAVFQVAVWVTLWDWLLPPALIVIICFVACWLSPSALSQFVFWPHPGEFMVRISITVWGMELGRLLGHWGQAQDEWRCWGGLG